MIHQFKNNGYNIVLDVNSGAVHVVDDLAYDIISDINSGLGLDDIVDKYQGDNQADDIRAVYEEIYELIDNNILFSKDIYEPFALGTNSTKKVIKALCLHIAHDCNLACKYCFADEGEYRGGKRELMSYEVGKAAIDFLVKASDGRKNLEVDFFGGEPLMNLQVVKDLVLYARSLEKSFNKKFRFTLTTNGVLLKDDIYDFLNKEMSNIVLSIDGRKEVHDKMRPFRNGKGSYDFILPKYLDFVESRGHKDYYVRGTFTANNTDFFEDFISMMKAGFKRISIEPAVSFDGEDFSLTQEQLPAIFKEYDRLAKYLAEENNDEELLFFHFMLDLTGGPCMAKRLSGCGSGTEYLAVTPTGELYPCHQFVGNDDFYLGDVFQGIKNRGILKDFDKVNVYTKEDCKSCFAKFYCSGGCASNAYNATGDLYACHDMSCILERKRVECALMIQAARSSIANG